MLKSGSTRIHVDVKTQQFPVIFSYHQLKKRGQKSQTTSNGLPIPELTNEDDFFKELLKKAEKYNLEDEADAEEEKEEGKDKDKTTNEDDDDEGSDDGSTGDNQRGNEYDYEDPFIDDSEMLLDDDYDYDIPEIDGFFVYSGPLDSNENSEDKKAGAASNGQSSHSNKRRSAAKTKNTTTTATKTSKPRKKEDTANTPSQKTKSKKAVVPTSTPTVNQETTAKVPVPNTSSNNNTNVKKISKSPAPSTPGPSLSSPASAPAATTVPAAPMPSTSSAIPSESNKRQHSLPSEPPKKKKTETGDNNRPIVIQDEDKKKKGTEVPPLLPLDSELEAVINRIREGASKESFENKAKFPESLKPAVLEAGLISFRRNPILDVNLIHHLMTCLPYNRFTLRKFITTKSGQMRVDELQQEIDELAIKLKQTIDKMMPAQQQMHEARVAALKQAKAVKVATAAANNNGFIDVDALEPDEELEPKFKYTDEVRQILYDIMKADEQSTLISNLITQYRNGANNTKDAEKLVAEGKARKLMYQRLLSCWPDGWMNTYEISRQYNLYKNKIAGSQNGEGKKRRKPSEDHTHRKKAREDEPKEEHHTPKGAAGNSPMKVESLVNVI
ncbi:hypothetical protein RMATCC62417_08061 [Rhizopus microsporus]|nr:hypothetical protein RMATCC62417_08061 [Rhizopus microsporus]